MASSDDQGSPNQTDEEDESLRNLILENMHIICENIDPCKFLIHFRSLHILCRDDCAEVRATVVPSQRAGKFIDMILTKGSNAIRSFLQHLGYHYPEIYRRIMKAKPQSPPKDYFKRLSQSSDLNPPLISVIESLMREYKQKKEISAQLDAVKKQAEELQDEKTLMKETLEDMDRMQAENERLRKERNQAKQETARINERALMYVEQRDALQKTCVQLRRERDDAIEQQRRTKEENDELQMTKQVEQKKESISSERWSSERQASQRLCEQLQEEIRSLRYQLDQYKASQYTFGMVNVPRAIPDSQKGIVEELKTSNEILNHQIRQYMTQSEDTAKLLTQREFDLHNKERFCDDLQAELDGKRICVETLEQQRIISQQRMEECWKHLANMRAERDQALEQMSEMLRRWQFLSSERDHLGEQLKLQMKQCDLVEQENYQLRKENPSSSYQRRKRVINVNEYEDVKLPNIIKEKRGAVIERENSNPFNNFPSFHGIRRRHLKNGQDVGEEEWLVTVKTSDMLGAGTDATVKLVLYGRRNNHTVRSEEIDLTSKSVSFKTNSAQSFKIITPLMGRLYKLRIGHDNTGTAPGWHLTDVVLNLMGTDEKYVFKYNNWLSTRECGYQIVREIVAEGVNITSPPPVVKYSVEVVTRPLAPIKKEDKFYVVIVGEYGDTGRRLLTQKKKLTKSEIVNEFTIAAVSLGQLQKIKLDIGTSSKNAKWFVESVTAKEVNKPQNSLLWACNRWFPYIRRHIRRRPALAESSLNIKIPTFKPNCPETNCPRNTSPCISDTLFVETNSLYQSDPESSDSDDSDDGSEGRSDTVESTATQQTQALAQQDISLIRKMNLALMEEVTFKTPPVNISSEARPKVFVKMKGSSLKHSIEGGNFVGLFIGKIAMDMKDKIEVGLQLIQVRDEAKEKVWNMLNMTLEEARSVFDQCLVPVEATFQKNVTDYESLKVLMQSHPESFYIRSNIDIEGDEFGALPLSKGDIVHVTETTHGFQKWYGNKVEPRTGSPTSLSGTLPSIYKHVTAANQDRNLDSCACLNQNQLSACGKSSFLRQHHTDHSAGVPPLNKQRSEEKPTLPPKPRHVPKKLLSVPGDLTTIRGNDIGDGNFTYTCSGQTDTVKPYTYVNPHKGKCQRPVILVCKDEFFLSVKDVLGKYFQMDIRRETTRLSPSECDTLIASGQCIHEVQQGDGHQCLLTSSLVEVISDHKSSKHVLLRLPVDCISRMHRVCIYPIVIVVKTSLLIKNVYEKDLLERGISFEYVCLTPLELPDAELICKKLHDAVAKAQLNIEWIQQDHHNDNASLQP